MGTLSLLQEVLDQKEQALIQYVRYMRISQDSGNQESALLFANLAKAEEKHIAVIRNQMINMSGNDDLLNKYQRLNESNSPHLTYSAGLEH
ncbi:hypothetical protein [Candidatus Formimonas warabiya]|uniref:Rubrerythrin diiron-binding domain-containing protein n=1 Tax=Formimonas warabiya TaxID=1761012 RepID=A0A3G1KM27_FORW1|nr:hypothetical protein [Candidatus Formimonas warabiya]ATW23488.1 hypothetical protein DCMF_00575 [Candidatus Formimonas warabiya]